MKVSKYLTILIVVFLASCTGEKQSAELKNMYDEVMVIHDEVMPKMRNINQAKKKLRRIDDYEDHQEVVEMIRRLDDADEAMMSWMADFKKPDATDEEAAKAYYAEQKKEIEAVRDLMLSAIEEAEEMASSMTEAS